MSPSVGRSRCRGLRHRPARCDQRRPRRLDRVGPGPKLAAQRAPSPCPRHIAPRGPTLPAAAAQQLSVGWFVGVRRLAAARRDGTPREGGGVMPRGQCSSATPDAIAAYWPARRQRGKYPERRDRLAMESGRIPRTADQPRRHRPALPAARDSKAGGVVDHTGAVGDRRTDRCEVQRSEHRPNRQAGILHRLDAAASNESRWCLRNTTSLIHQCMCGRRTRCLTMRETLSYAFCQPTGMRCPVAVDDESSLHRRRSLTLRNSIIALSNTAWDGGMRHWNRGNAHDGW